MEDNTNTTMPGIALFPVESTRISAAGYDPVTKVLAIQFKDSAGRTYRYQGVPEGIWDGFNKAESKGAYFYSAIYKQFGFVRVEEDGTVSKSWSPDPQAEQPATEQKEAA